MNIIGIYLCFSLDHDLDAARATFTARYGHEPEQVFTWLRMVWVGPVTATTSGG